MSTSEITKDQVLAAQKAWGDGIVRIAAAHTAGEGYEQIAREHVKTLYAYDLGSVLFKPTLAAKEQFRSTFEQAVSYFVATNKVCPEDGGFAIKGWTAVRFDNVDILIQGATAMAMGNYFFTDPKGVDLKVEYSFGYIRDDSGSLRIVLHHSSMPHDPSKA